MPHEFFQFPGVFGKTLEEEKRIISKQEVGKGGSCVWNFKAKNLFFVLGNDDVSGKDLHAQNKKVRGKRVTLS